MRFLKGDLKDSQNLTTGALSYTTTYSKGFKLNQILIKFSVPVTETITITLDSKEGTVYDTVLRSKGLVGESSFVYKPEGDPNFAKGDQIKIQCTNANKTGTAYLIVKSREIG